MSFKIQINSVEALGRLVGEPSDELVMEIRSSVVKELANHPKMKDTLREEVEVIRKEAQKVAQQVGEECMGVVRKTTWGYQPSYDLKEDVKQSIREEAGRILGSMIAETTKRYIESLNLDKIIEKAVSDRLNIAIKEEVRSQVQHKIALIAKEFNT
jgi:hypothetical protein